MNNELDKTFHKAKKIKLKTPYALETRVLAVLRDRKKEGSRFHIWRGIALAGWVGCLTLALVTLTKWDFYDFFPKYQIKIDQPAVVRIDLKPLEAEKAVYAQIELPEGVYFYSEKNPELIEKKRLLVAWTPDSKKRSFPFVIRGHEPGTKLVSVNLFDQENNIISQRHLRIKFLN